MENGIVMKSAAHNGCIMTRCMVRKDFFHDKIYNLEIVKSRSDSDVRNVAIPEIEFCLPYSELKALVDIVSF